MPSFAPPQQINTYKLHQRQQAPGRRNARQLCCAGPAPTVGAPTVSSPWAYTSDARGLPAVNMHDGLGQPYSFLIPVASVCTSKHLECSYVWHEHVAHVSWPRSTHELPLTIGRLPHGTPLHDAVSFPCVLRSRKAHLQAAMALARSRLASQCWVLAATPGRRYTLRFAHCLRT